MSEILTVTHDGVTYMDMSPDDLLEAGVPQEAIDAALAARRAGAVKAECKRRIYGVLSAEAQMNITAVSATIAAKSASSRSAEEKATLAGAQAALGWVDAMRARAAELAADADADFLAGSSWPDCPQEVIDLAARF